MIDFSNRCTPKKELKIAFLSHFIIFFCNKSKGKSARGDCASVNCVTMSVAFLLSLWLLPSFFHFPVASYSKSPFPLELGVRDRGHFAPCRSVPRRCICGGSGADHSETLRFERRQPGNHSLQFFQVAQLGCHCQGTRSS